MVLVHGITESLEFWTEQQQHGIGSRKLIALDLPGHGLSDEVDDASVQNFARIVNRFAEILQMPTFIGVGNSLGCTVLLQLAVIASNRMSALVLASPALVSREIFVPFRVLTIPFVGDLLMKMIPPSAFASHQMSSIVYNNAVMTPELRSAALRNFSRPNCVTVHLRTLRAHHNIWGVLQTDVDEHRRILRTSFAPVLLMHGREDTVLPVRGTIDAHKDATNTTLVIFDDCGHTAQLEKPADFSATVIEFLAQSGVR